VKKYIFIPSLAFGGAEKVVASLFKADVIKNNCDLMLISHKLDYRFDGVNLSLMTPCRFLSMILKRDISVVQCHLVLPLLLGSILKLFNRSFELQAVHCFSYQGYLCRRGRYFELPMRYLLKFCLKMVDTHVFKSIDMVDDFKQTFGFEPHNYEIIHNPIDLTREPNLTEGGEIDLLSVKKTHVAVLGRVCRSKGSFEIFELAKVCDGAFVFHVIGDGIDYREFVHIAKGYPGVYTYGRLSNPFGLVSQCELYLSLSHNEGFPNALVEAMVLGLYPIHSNCKTGPRELLGGSYNYDVPQLTEGGFLFPPGDIPSCNLGLSKYLCMSEIDKLAVLKRNKQITENFESSKILAQYTKVLRI